MSEQHIVGDEGQVQHQAQHQDQEREQKLELAISLKNVTVNYRLRNAHHFNLKRALANGITRKKEDAEIISALQNFSLDVPKGSRIGITGPNGSGKSTLLAVIAGAITPTSGTCTVNGKVLALLGGPNEGLDPEQTGRENALSLSIKLGFSSVQANNALDDIQEFSGLGHRFDHPVYTYSSGMQVRLRFSTITSFKADILLVDEGIGAADSEFNERANDRLTKFYAESGTLILASHATEILHTHCEQMIDLRNRLVTKD